MPIDKRRCLVLASAAALLAASGAAAVATAGTASAAAADCGRLFDDFAYSSSGDAALTRNGWVP